MKNTRSQHSSAKENIRLMPSMSQDQNVKPSATLAPKPDATEDEDDDEIIDLISDDEDQPQDAVKTVVQTPYRGPLRMFPLSTGSSAGAASSSRTTLLKTPSAQSQPLQTNAGTDLPTSASKKQRTSPPKPSSYLSSLDFRLSPLGKGKGQATHQDTDNSQPIPSGLAAAMADPGSNALGAVMEHLKQQMQQDSVDDGLDPTCMPGVAPTMTEEDIREIFAHVDLTGNDVVKGTAAMTQEELDFKVPGLTVQLLKHQVMGVMWMMKTEGKIRGGILADDMGLGKTVQAMSLMLKNRPKPNSRERTTLIVTPVALLHQWYNELVIKAPNQFNIHIYYGTFRAQSLEELKQYDVVITSYSTLGYECPRDGPDPDQPGSPAGPLFHMRYHRVILDEVGSLHCFRVFKPTIVA